MGTMDMHRPKWFAPNFEGEMELQILTSKGWRWQKEIAEEKKAKVEQQKKLEAEKVERTNEQENAC